MNLPPHALGIDLGTTAVKVVAIAEDSRISGQCQVDLQCAGRGKTATSTQDPKMWWAATRKALASLGQKIDLLPIQALSIDATSGTVLAVDKQGHPLGHGRMYNDHALPRTVETLAHILPEDSAARGATSPLARMIEMQRPGVHRLLHQADWLTAQFSGRFDISDENNALKSGFDLTAREWPAWVGDAPLDLNLLPQVIPSGVLLGLVRPTIAAQFGFQPTLRIVSGTTDGCASFVASGAHTLGDAVTSLGTTLTLKQVCEKQIAAAHYGIYSHRLAEFWVCGGASNSGGGVLLQYFSKSQLKSLEPKMNPERSSLLSYYPLPSVGERFPFADASLKPKIEPRPNDNAQFLQGLLEGIATIERAGYSRLTEVGAPPLRQVFTVGGGASNQSWQVIRERVLGVPVHRGFADPAYGAALIALSALKQRSPFELHLERRVREQEC